MPPGLWIKLLLHNASGNALQVSCPAAGHPARPTRFISARLLLGKPQPRLGELDCSCRLLSVLLERLLPEANGTVAATPTPLEDAAGGALALGSVANTVHDLARQHAAAAAAANEVAERHLTAARAHSEAVRQLLASTSDFSFGRLAHKLSAPGGKPLSPELQALLEGHAAGEPQVR